MSFGTKVGRAIGSAGALFVEGAVRGGNGLGRFATDVVDGVEVGYAEKHAALLVTRAQKDAARKDRLEAAKAAHALTMSAPAAPVAPTKRAMKAAA